MGAGGGGCCKHKIRSVVRCTGKNAGKFSRAKSLALEYVQNTRNALNVVAIVKHLQIDIIAL